MEGRSYFPFKFKGLFLPLSGISFLCFNSVSVGRQDSSALSPILMFRLVSNNFLSRSHPFYFLFYLQAVMKFPHVNISTHHSIGKPIRILILFWSSHFILHTSPKNTLHCHICTKIKYIKNTFYLEKLMQIT